MKHRDIRPEIELIPGWRSACRGRAATGRPQCCRGSRGRAPGAQSPGGSPGIGDWSILSAVSSLGASLPSRIMSKS